MAIEVERNAAPGVVGRIVPAHMTGTREHQLLEQLIDGEGYTSDEVVTMLDRILEWVEGADE